jgi:hypothetical protein
MSSIQSNAAPDVAALLGDALRVIGCDTAAFEDFDAHSPIELSFQSGPALIVNPLGDSVEFSAELAEVSDYAFEHAAPALLKALAATLDWANPPHLFIEREDQRVWLIARPGAAACASSEAFAHALVDFYAQADALSGVVK